MIFERKKYEKRLRIRGVLRVRKKTMSREKPGTRSRSSDSLKLEEDSMSLDTFVSSKDTFTISPGASSFRLRTPLSPKRKLRENSTSFSPKRKISIERKVEKENKEYKRPQAPMRPVPHMPPKISIVKPEQEDEIEAKFSISKALEQPLYLSSARILNTPENSSEESFESREDILKLKSPIQSQEDSNQSQHHTLERVHMI